MKTFDPQTTLELEAAAFRRLVDHLRSRPDVQNIDMMNLAGFCRNCLSGWIAEGKLKPLVGAVLPLAHAADAYRRMQDRKSVGKIVLEI